MKRVAVIFAIVAVLSLLPTVVFAETEVPDTVIEVMEDGSYFETIIVDEEASVFSEAVNTIKGITIKGAQRTRTKSTVTAASNSDLWKVTNKAASKSGSKASATATGTRYQNGVAIQKLVKTVTLKCSPTGDFS